MIRITIKSNMDTDLVSFAKSVADSIANNPEVGYGNMFIVGDPRYVGRVHHSFGYKLSQQDITIKIKQQKPNKKGS